MTVEQLIDVAISGSPSLRTFRKVDPLVKFIASELRSMFRVHMPESDAEILRQAAQAMKRLSHEINSAVTALEAAEEKGVSCG